MSTQSIFPEILWIEQEEAMVQMTPTTMLKRDKDKVHAKNYWVKRNKIFMHEFPSFKYKKIHNKPNVIKSNEENHDLMKKVWARVYPYVSFRVFLTALMRAASFLSTNLPRSHSLSALKNMQRYTDRSCFLPLQDRSNLCLFKFIPDFLSQEPILCIYYSN